MGGLFGGSSSTKTNNTVDTGPSKFQQPYLTNAFNSAQSNYDSAKGTPFYQGDLHAGMSGDAKADLSSMRDYATGTGLGTAKQLSEIGTSMSGYGARAGSTIDGVLSLANGDATADNIKAASAYANNPFLDGQIDAVNRDVSRSLAEVTLPGIDRAASGTGNINSSRAGVAAGIAQRGAEDRMADNAAALRGQAYQSGLSLAQNDRSQRLNAMGTAANAFTGLAGMGLDALSKGTQAGYGAFNVVNAANQTEQADRQGQLDADFDKWKGEDTRATDLLNRYYQIIGSNQWGQYGKESGKSTTKQSGGLLQTVLGGAALAGGLGWQPLK